MAAGKKTAAQAPAPRLPVTFVHRYIDRGVVVVCGESLYVRHRRLTVDEPAMIEALEQSGDWLRDAPC